MKLPDKMIASFQARIQATMLNSYFKLESASFPEALKAAFSDGKLQMNWRL